VRSAFGALRASLAAGRCPDDARCPKALKGNEGSPRPSMPITSETAPSRYLCTAGRRMVSPTCRSHTKYQAKIPVVRRSLRVPDGEEERHGESGRARLSASTRSREGASEGAPTRASRTYPEPIRAYESLSSGSWAAAGVVGFTAGGRAGVGHGRWEVGGAVPGDPCWRAPPRRSSEGRS
jgi:hypothetical protein